MHTVGLRCDEYQQAIHCTNGNAHLCCCSVVEKRNKRRKRRRGKGGNPHHHRDHYHSTIITSTSILRTITTTTSHNPSSLPLPFYSHSVHASHWTVLPRRRSRTLKIAAPTTLVVFESSIFTTRNVHHATHVPRYDVVVCFCHLCVGCMSEVACFFDFVAGCVSTKCLYKVRRDISSCTESKHRIRAVARRYAALQCVVGWGDGPPARVTQVGLRRLRVCGREHVQSVSPADFGVAAIGHLDSDRAAIRSVRAAPGAHEMGVQGEGSHEVANSCVI